MKLTCKCGAFIEGPDAPFCATNFLKAHEGCLRAAEPKIMQPKDSPDATLKCQCVIRTGQGAGVYQLLTGSADLGDIFHCYKQEKE